MIYLDYAAHTPVDERVLAVYSETTLKYIGNPNSSHEMGRIARNKLEESTKNIAEMMGVKPSEIIFTSGATESNNLAIKGIAEEYKGTGKHIITTYLEHSSVTGPVTVLQNLGYEVDYVDILENGQVDLEHLKELLREDTILVSICYVDSEVGTCQPIEKIGKLLKDYPACHFHVDATQAIGKVPVNFENVDLLTFSAHKIYGLCGFGVLIKKEEVRLQPQIHGGLSDSPYRSGTPMLSFIVSLEKAIELTLTTCKEHFTYVSSLNTFVRENLTCYKNIIINTPKDGSPYILNMSIPGCKTEDLLVALSNSGVYISTKSACCATNTPSRPVYGITKNRKAALSTLRISFSHKTTMEEVKEFLRIFEACYLQLEI